MNPTCYIVFGVICLIAAIIASIFGIVFACLSFDGCRIKNESIIYFVGGIFCFVICGISGYGATTMLWPDPETLYQRVLDDKPECDINKVSCIKEMTKWLADSSLSYMKFQTDSVDAAEKYNMFKGE